MHSFNNSFVRGLVHWTRLADLEIAIKSRYTNDKFIENFIFFLKYRGKKLILLSLDFLPHCQLLDLTDSIVEYCSNLVDLRVYRAKLDFNRLGSLSKLRVLNAYVSKDIDSSDLDTLLASNRQLRRLTIELHEVKSYSKIDNYLKASAICREHSFPRLRVNLTNITKDEQ